MFLIRFVLGKILILLNALLPAKRQINRTAEEKVALRQKFKSASLYQFVGCPFCIKVRRALKRMDLELELRNCESGPFREELLKFGGEIQVPCLRIQEESGSVRWMYESDAIISYLESQLATFTRDDKAHVPYSS